MPTYLSVNFQYSKRLLSGQTVREFCDALLRCGLTFAGGYWEAEGNSYDDIVGWNQAKLEQNFELPEDAHYTHGYRQMLFSFGDFSEVRLYILNERKEPFFSFELIVPEEVLLTEETATGQRLQSRPFAMIEDLAVRMWEEGQMDCIQAYWEIGDRPKPFADIAAGVQPCCMPFCVIPRQVLRDKWKAPCRQVGRNGCLIRDIDMFMLV